MIPFAGGELEARRWRAIENLTFLAETESSNDLAVELIDMYFEEDERFPTTVLIAESEPGAHGRTGSVGENPRSLRKFRTRVTTSRRASTILSAAGSVSARSPSG